MDWLFPSIAALVCAGAAINSVRAAVTRRQDAARLASEKVDPDLWRISHHDYERERQTAVFLSLAAVTLLVVAVMGIGFWFSVLASLVAIPAFVSLLRRRDYAEVARIASKRVEVEQRARDVLSQEELAPLQWAARLAPSALPKMPGLEIGQEYQAGSGAMSGDFYDVFKVDGNRIAAVIGDVTGHGIEPSITALQAKYLLRTFLLQFRDPGQALEQLNANMTVLESGEEFISLCVLVFDAEAETLRYASAGHPAAFLWHEGEVRPLVATGPLLMLDPNGTFRSRELAWQTDDVAVLYTDGLSEARNGTMLFGEDGVASMIRRDPTASPDVLTKSLVEAARDFAAGPINDDVAILVVRRI